MRTIALLALLAICGASNPAEPIRTAPGDIVITNVTVVPMDRDTTIRGQAVVVRGDTIFAIASDEDVHIDKDVAARIDGSGKWLMPGLVDMHVHVWNENDLVLFVAAGVTTVRNMYGSDLHLAWRTDISGGKRFGPTLITASPIIDGDPPVWPGSIVLTRPEDADSIVAGLKDAGYDFLKPYALLQKPAYDALAVAGRKYGMTLQGHVPKGVGLEAAIAAGQKSIEHLDGWIEALAPSHIPSAPAGNYWKTMAHYLAAADESKIPGIVDKVRRAGSWNCPTLIVTERMSRLDDVASIEQHTRWLDLISPETRAAWNPNTDFRLKAATPEDFAAMKRANALRARIVKQLATSDAPLIVGTDTGNPYVVPGESMHDEIELLVAAGAPRPRVMRAATADAGRFLGTPDRMGVVAPGARANLLLVSVDPMVQPLPLIPDGVVIRGKWLSKADLQGKLESIAKPPVVANRFESMPALVPEGTDIVQARYSIKAGSGDKTVGEERLAIGRRNQHRVIVSQMVSDVPTRMEIGYRIAGQETSMSMKSGYGSFELVAKPENGSLTAIGKDIQGKPVTDSQPITTDMFLAGPGMGGTIELADKMTGMKIGERRKATSLELSFFPNLHIEKGDYEIERTPDVDGKRTFAVTYGFATMKVKSTLTLDERGLPLRQVFGSPIDQTFVREQ